MDKVTIKCHMCLYVTASGVGRVLPDLYLLASVSTEEAMVLVIRYSGHYGWAHEFSGPSSNAGW